MSDCCLTPLSNFQHNIWWDDNDVHFVLTTQLTGFYSASSLFKTTVHRQTCRSTRTHYPNSEPTRLCSFSFLMRALRRCNPWSTTLEANMLTITSPMGFLNFIVCGYVNVLHEYVIYVMNAFYIYIGNKGNSMINKRHTSNSTRRFA